MDQKQIDAHIKEIGNYQRQINQIPKENKRKRIELLSEQLVYIGKLAGEFSEEYKETYATRKQVQAEAEIEAAEKKLKGGKEAHGELAAVEWRKTEAEAYGNMKRWGNAFVSTDNLIQALKFDIKIDMNNSPNIGA